jgi:hypothetical protein
MYHTQAKAILNNNDTSTLLATVYFPKTAIFLGLQAVFATIATSMLLGVPVTSHIVRWPATIYQHYCFGPGGVA